MNVIDVIVFRSEQIFSSYIDHVFVCI